MKSPVNLLKNILRWIKGHPRLSLVVGAGLLAVLIISFRAVETRPPKSAYYEVRRGNFVVSVVEGGSVEAVRELSIRCEVEGTARIIYLVPEGTYVKKGDLLVELDSSQAQDQYDQQLLAVQKAELAYIQAQQQLAIQESQAESDIRAAELALKFAQMDLEKFLKAEYVTTLLEASNNVANIEAKLAIDLNTYEWSKKLAEKGYETKRTVDSDELTVRQDRYQLLINSNRLYMLINFDLPKQREQLVSAVEEAKRELERVKQRAERTLAQYRADVLTQSNSLELQKRLLERYKRNLEACKIYAPADGLVVYPVRDARFSQESMIEEGAIVRNRQELIKLPDTSQMKVRLQIHESWINLIKEGLPALVVLEPMPDRTFKGVVSKVALLPDSASRWMNPNLKVYGTEVLILDPLPPTVKPGVSARAEIIVTNIPNALYVPIQAVTVYKGKPAVYVHRDGKDVPVHVEVGMFNTSFIQILSGLNEGDRVLLTPPIETEGKSVEGGGLLAASEPGGVLPAQAAPTAARTEAGEAGRRDAGADRTGASAQSERSPGQPGPGQSMDRGEQSRGLPGGRIPEAVLQRFDRDGDGQLSAEERQAMREAFRRMRESDGSGPGPAGGGQDAPHKGNKMINEELLMREAGKQSTAEMIRTVDLWKIYQLSAEVRVEALRGVNLTVYEGEYVAIMGPSGSGKSTLLNVLGCLDRPTAGKYFLGGQDVSTLDDDQLSEIRGRRIGFIFQSYNLIPQLTVLENIQVPLIYQGKDLRRYRDRCLELARMVGLGDRLDHRPTQLSGGQQQRVAIARALVNDPLILLADEPTGNLDSKTGLEVMAIIDELNRRGKTIILVTHDEKVARHARRIIHMKDGQIDREEINEEAVPETVGLDRPAR